MKNLAGKFLEMSVSSRNRETKKETIYIYFFMYVQNIILLNPYPAKNYATYYNGGGGRGIYIT